MLIRICAEIPAVTWAFLNCWNGMRPSRYNSQIECYNYRVQFALALLCNTMYCICSLHIFFGSGVQLILAQSVCVTACEYVWWRGRKTVKKRRGCLHLMWEEERGGGKIILWLDLKYAHFSNVLFWNRSNWNLSNFRVTQPSLSASFDRET